MLTSLSKGIDTLHLTLARKLVAVHRNITNASVSRPTIRLHLWSRFSDSLMSSTSVDRSGEPEMKLSESLEITVLAIRV